MPEKKRARKNQPPANASATLVPEKLAPLVLLIGREKVILDFHLAELYGVETRALKQAVKRNLGRFPDDFMFQLTEDEAANLVSQSVIPSPSRLGGALPYAFTEQGVAMLSSVLRSPRAVEVNIAIMRTFVQLRRLMDSNELLAKKIESLERKYSDHDKQFSIVFEAIKALIAEDKKPGREIGFHTVPGGDGG